MISLLLFFHFCHDPLGSASLSTPVDGDWRGKDSGAKRRVVPRIIRAVVRTVRRAIRSRVRVLERPHARNGILAMNPDTNLPFAAGFLTDDWDKPLFKCGVWSEKVWSY